METTDILAIIDSEIQLSRQQKLKGRKTSIRELLRQSNHVSIYNDVEFSPEEVIEKILFQHKIFGHQRFLIQMSLGLMPHDKVLESIELFGTKVAPIVREEVARREKEDARATAG